MVIEILPVESKSALREFILLPSKLYKNEARWVPPIFRDEWNFHNLRKNKALEYCDVARFLAVQAGMPVGRIMGIIHHPYNKHHNEQTARFFNFDCVNDQETAHALVHAVEAWAMGKGLTKIIGPFGFSDKDPQGLQIEGFEYLPVLATPANPSYLPGLLIKEGYQKEIDCVSYQMDIPRQIPTTYRRVYERIRKNQAIKLIEFKSKRQLKPYIIPVLQLVNEAYAPIFGFTPLTEEEMRSFAAQYLPVLDPEFVKVVVNAKAEVVAFVVAMPDMSPGIQKAKGRLFPVGFLFILNSMGKAKQLNLMLGAIKKGFRGVGLSVLMGKSIIESAVRRGMTIMDSHLILENNLPMRGECEKLNGVVRKRYRIFSKNLT